MVFFRWAPLTLHALFWTVAKMPSQFEKLRQRMNALLFGKQHNPSPNQKLYTSPNLDRNRKHVGTVATCIVCSMSAGSRNEPGIEHQESQSKDLSLLRQSDEGLKPSPVRLLPTNQLLSRPSEQIPGASPLFSLPNELRLKIYEHLFADGMMKAEYSGWNRGADPFRQAFFFSHRNYHWRLLLTCRALYQEARPVLARCTSYILMNIDNAVGWDLIVQRLRPWAGAIQHLTLSTGSPFPYREPYQFDMSAFQDLQTFTIVLRDPRFTDFGRVEVSDLETTMDWLRGKHDDVLVKRYASEESSGRYCRWCRGANPYSPVCLHQVERALLPNRTFRLHKHLAFSVQLCFTEGGKAVQTPDGKTVRSIQRRGWLIYDEDSKQVVETQWVQCKKTKGWPRRARRECVVLNRQSEGFWADANTNFTYRLNHYHGIFPYETDVPRDERWTNGMRRQLT